MFVLTQVVGDVMDVDGDGNVWSVDREDTELLHANMQGVDRCIVTMTDTFRCVVYINQNVGEICCFTVHVLHHMSYVVCTLKQIFFFAVVSVTWAYTLFGHTQKHSIEDTFDDESEQTTYAVFADVCAADNRGICLRRCAFCAFLYCTHCVHRVLVCHLSSMCWHVMCRPCVGMSFVVYVICHPCVGMSFVVHVCAADDTDSHRPYNVV